MSYTIEQIGARAKARNPEKLGNFSDAEIGQKLVDRNPALADMVKPTETAPMTPATPEPEQKGLLGGIASGLGNVAVGAAKGLGSTIAGASALGEKMMSAPLKAVGAPVQEDYLGERVQEKLKPEGLAQKIGFGAEQIGEFLIPGAAPVKAAKAAQVGLGLAKAEKAVGVAGKAAKAAEAAKGLGRLGTRMGTEAAAVGGVAAIQQGELGDEAVGAAKFGAAVPIIGKGLSAVGATGRALGIAPDKIINSLIKPLQRDFFFGKNPGAGVAKEGIVANSWDDLIDKLGAKTEEIGEQIGTTLKGATQRVSLSGVMKPLDDAIVGAKTAPGINAPLITRLETAKKDITRIIRKKKQITPQEAFKIKQSIANLTKFTEPLTDNALNKALKGIYGNIKEKINVAVPAVKELNERYANIKTAHIAAKYRDRIIERQNVLPLASKIAGGVSGFSFGSIPGALLGVMAGATVERGLASPAFKTRVAAALQKMSIVERREAIKNPIVKNFLNRVFGSSDEVQKVIKNPKAPSLKMKKKP
jgi:hypothetical protein